MALQFFSRWLENDKTETVKLPELATVVEAARQDWLAAQQYYNTVVDEDLIDHAVYMMQATERKYVYLLKQAREIGLTHTPYQQASATISQEGKS